MCGDNVGVLIFHNLDCGHFGGREGKRKLPHLQTLQFARVDLQQEIAALSGQDDALAGTGSDASGLMHWQAQEAMPVD